jgi:hypothetical protein
MPQKSAIDKVYKSEITAVRINSKKPAKKQSFVLKFCFGEETSYSGKKIYENLRSQTE